MNEMLANFGTCETCGATITGSHYHCSCGTPDATSMYGHHGSFCRISGKHEGFHHCGPDGACELNIGQGL